MATQIREVIIEAKITGNQPQLTTDLADKLEKRVQQIERLLRQVTATSKGEEVLEDNEER